MAVLSQASDLTTRQTIWVAHDIVKGKDQINSHNRADFNCDGLSAADWASLYAEKYQNDAVVD
jgi:hypothetical protein